MKFKLEHLLTYLKGKTQVIILSKSDKREIIRGKVKDIIRSQSIKNHCYDKVESVKDGGIYLEIEISLDW